MKSLIIILFYYISINNLSCVITLMYAPDFAIKFILVIKTVTKLHGLLMDVIKFNNNVKNNFR